MPVACYFTNAATYLVTLAHNQEFSKPVYGSIFQPIISGASISHTFIEHLYVPSALGKRK